MTVRFDELTLTWRIVTDDGSVIADGFATEAAWQWHDSRSEDDLADAVTHDRIANAIRSW